MLSNKVALITGSSRGLGREIALTFARYGADVAINYNGSEDRAHEVAEAVRKLGVKAIVIKGNVANYDDSKEIIDKIIEEFGKIDVLVNNAGITRDNLLMKMSEEDFDNVIDVNLKGTFNCMKHVSRIMIKQRFGRIINMSSVVGVNGNAGQVNYAASKAGIIGMTKSFAKEVGVRGITVNAIAPGFIDTEMTQVLSDSVKEGILSQIPMKKMGNAQDIAETAAFLASDKAGYITGQVINVNGGMA